MQHNYSVFVYMWGLCSTAKGKVTVWIILGNDNQCERSGMLSGKSCSVCQCLLPSAGCSSILSGLLFPILRPSIITTFTEETHLALTGSMSKLQFARHILRLDSRIDTQVPSWPTSPADPTESCSSRAHPRMSAAKIQLPASVFSLAGD